MTQTALDDLLGLLVTKALARVVPTRDEMSVLLTTSDDDVVDVVAAGSRVRRHFFGMRVKLNHLVNMKSGLCPEDCSYCSQRLGSTAEIMKYSWISPEEAAGNAERAIAAGAKRCAWWPADADRANGTWTGSRTLSLRSRTPRRRSRYAPAWACSRPGRPIGCGRLARMPTTTT